MRIVIAGATGLIGTVLCSALKANGYEVIQLVRDKEKVGPHRVYWDPAAGILDPAVLNGCIAVINLAGKNISCRWTESNKQKIHHSRLQATSTLVSAVAAQESPPKVFINASATGYKGARHDEVLFEPSDHPLQGFLATVTEDWEQALMPAEKKGVRCVTVRFGVVLSKEGGALKSMLWPFKLGMGGKIGNGEQHMEWIAIDDAVQGIIYILENNHCRGAYAFASPHRVTNAEFTKTLGRILHRPTFLSIPKLMVQWMFGQLADELLLNDAQVQPQKLLDVGYTFTYPDLEAALRHELK